MRDHQAAFSRNHCTVLRRPLSKVSCGAQPSSSRDLGRVDGIAQVMPGPVLDEGDQPLARADAAVRRNLVDSAQIVSHDLEVGPLATAADVVALADPAALGDE